MGGVLVTLVVVGLFDLVLRFGLLLDLFDWLVGWLGGRLGLSLSLLLLVFVCFCSYDMFDGRVDLFSGFFFRRFF